MISVRDLQGNLYTVSSDQAVTGQDLYQALSSEYNLVGVKLYAQGSYLPPDPCALSADVLDGTHTVGLIYSNPQSSASSSAESGVSVDRFAHFHFMRFSDLALPEQTDAGEPHDYSSDYSRGIPDDALNHSDDAMLGYRGGSADLLGDDVHGIWFANFLGESMSDGRNDIIEEEEEEERGERARIARLVWSEGSPINQSDQSENGDGEGLEENERVIVDDLVEAFGQDRRAVLRAFYANGRDGERTANYLARRLDE
jgi:hypothetical protein